MKRFQLLAALFMTQLIMGCCCGRSFVVDSCDPCYTPCQPCGCGLVGALKSLWPFGCCHGGCGSCYSPMYSEFPSSCDCGGGCGGGYTSSYGGMMVGAPASSGCNCGGGGGQMMAPQMQSMPTMSNPEPTPSPTIAPVPPTSPSDATGMAPMTSAPNVQHVSYEEFQKLPGTVTSGQGALMNAMPSAANNPVNIPAPAAPMMTPSVQKSIGSTQRFVPRSVAASAPLTAQTKPQMWVPAH